MRTGAEQDRRTTRPILVTGAHRSGTTWAGRMLAAADGVTCIHEPFHLKHRRGVLDVATPRWFTYIEPANEHGYLGPVTDMLAFRFALGAEARQLLTGRDPRTTVRAIRSTRTARRAAHRPLVKDPAALFSTEWLVERFGVAPVVMIRHPAAFAGSIVDRRWAFPFDHLVDQPLLMEAHLAPFGDEIAAAARRAPPLLEQAALLWRILYGFVARLQDDHPDWCFVRHEDLARDPLGGFERLYAHLGLDWTPGARATVEAHIAPEAPRHRPGNHDLVRDPEEVTRSWTRLLAPADVERLREQVGPAAARYYGDADW